MTYFFAEFEVDEAELLFFVRGEQVQLEPKVLRLLIYLLQNPNRLVRKQELLDALWPAATVTENALTRVVGLLRKALGDDSQNPRLLQTVPTAGYRFITDVRVRPSREAITSDPEDLASARDIGDKSVATVNSGAKSRGLWIIAGAAGVIVIATLALVSIYRGRKHATQPAPVATSAMASLTQTPLTTGDKIYLAAAQARNPAAFEAYTRGSYLFFNEISHGNDIDYAKASQELETAVRLDPTFAEPYAMLAQIYQRFVHHGRGDVRAEYARAYLLANKAIALNPKSFNAHIALGALHADREGDFAWEAAAEEIKTAIALNPASAQAHGLLGYVYTKTGLLDLGMKQIEIAHHLDPSFTIYTGQKVMALEYQQRFQEASDLCMTIVDKAGCVIYLWKSGQHDEAWAAVQAGMKSSEIREALGYNLVTSEAYLLAHKNERQAADRLIQSVLNTVDQKHDTSFIYALYQLGAAYAVMGEDARAIDLLESASLNGFPCYPLYANDPDLAQLRKNPRFIAVLDRLRRQNEIFRKTL